MNIKHRSKLEKEQRRRELEHRKAMHSFAPDRDIEHYCSKCKYRTTADYFHADTSYDKKVNRKPREHRWCCGYAIIRKDCANKNVNGKLVDTRGPGPGCNLFERGDPKNDNDLYFREPGRSFDMGRW